jgi:hypothetical protein
MTISPFAPALPSQLAGDLAGLLGTGGPLTPGAVDPVPVLPGFLAAIQHALTAAQPAPTLPQAEPDPAEAPVAVKASENVAVKVAARADRVKPDEPDPTAPGPVPDPASPPLPGAPAQPVTQPPRTAAAVSTRLPRTTAPSTPVGAVAATTRPEVTAPDSSPDLGHGSPAAHERRSRDLTSTEPAAAPPADSPAAPPTTPRSAPDPVPSLPVTMATPPVAPTIPTPTATPTATPTSTPPTVPAAVVHSQVFGEVTSLATQGTGTHRITLTLRPETLGEVRVVMTVRDGAVHVRMAAGSTEAHQALLEGTPELSRLLEHAGAAESRIDVRHLDAASTGSGATNDRNPNQQPGARTDPSARDGTGQGQPQTQSRNHSRDQAGDRSGHRPAVLPEVRTQPLRSTRSAGLDLSM